MNKQKFNEASSINKEIEIRRVLLNKLEDERYYIAMNKDSGGRFWDYEPIPLPRDLQEKFKLEYKIYLESEIKDLEEEFYKI